MQLHNQSDRNVISNLSQRDGKNSYMKSMGQRTFQTSENSVRPRKSIPGNFKKTRSPYILDSSEKLTVSDPKYIKELTFKQEIKKPLIVRNVSPYKNKAVFPAWNARYNTS